MAIISKRVPVDDRLLDVLLHFVTIQSEKDEEKQLFHLSPTLELMVVFNFGSPISASFGHSKEKRQVIDRITILGPIRKTLNYELSGKVDVLALPFMYDGVYRLLPDLQVNKHVAKIDKTVLEAYINGLEPIWEKLTKESSTADRIAVLTDFLLNEGLAKRDIELKPLMAAEADVHVRSINPVKSMANKASLSDRTVQLRFQKYVGYSPKELIRFLRFKLVVVFIREQTLPIDWFDIIVKFEYHDQSHLIKDFKYYTGLSPRQFLKVCKGDNFCMNHP